MSIDWDKPVQTRDGLEVRIYTTKGQDEELPVVGDYFDSSGFWMLDRWKFDGTSRLRPGHDLVNVVPKQHTVTINVYRYDGVIQVRSHVNRADADQRTTDSRIACIEVTFIEGEGLDEH